MLGRIAKHVLRSSANTPLRNYFGGAHHHEIDYYAVATKNMKSCIYLHIKNTILTQTMLQEESPE